MTTTKMEKKPQTPHTRHNRNAARTALALAAILMLCLAGCRTSKQTARETAAQSTCLSAKVKLTVPSKQSVLTVNGTLKLRRGERAQLSFLMPILRTEVARVEVTPDDILLVDRMGRRYVRATRDELKTILPRKADFAHLEKLICDAAQPGGKTVVTAEELGLTDIERGKIELSDFSTRPFDLEPTRLSDRYQQVSWHELLHLLMNL